MNTALSRLHFSLPRIASRSFKSWHFNVHTHQVHSVVTNQQQWVRDKSHDLTLVYPPKEPRKLLQFQSANQDVPKHAHGPRTGAAWYSARTCSQHLCCSICANNYGLLLWRHSYERIHKTNRNSQPGVFLSGQDKARRVVRMRVCLVAWRRPSSLSRSRQQFRFDCTDLDAGQVLDRVEGVFPAERGDLHRHRPEKQKPAIPRCQSTRET